MNNNLTSLGIVIRPASFNDIPHIQAITYSTYPSAYGSILSKDQIDYMLSLFYSSNSLRRQIEEQHYFFLALKEYKPIGFASFSKLCDEIFKLQKFYVMPEEQKSGAGTELLDTVKKTVKTMGGTRLRLNVNRYNIASVDYYKRKNFYIVLNEDINIGNGYFMNDYVMESQL